MDQIKSLIPVAKTGRLPKIIDLYLMQFYGLQEVEQHDVICQNDLAHGKTCTTVFARSVTLGALMSIFKQLNSDANYENISIAVAAVSATGFTNSTSSL